MCEEENGGKGRENEKWDSWGVWGPWRVALAGGKRGRGIVNIMVLTITL